MLIKPVKMVKGSNSEIVLTELFHVFSSKRMIPLNTEATKIKLKTFVRMM
jgi:hypothetical protein